MITLRALLALGLGHAQAGRPGYRHLAIRVALAGMMFAASIATHAWS